LFCSHFTCLIYGSQKNAQTRSLDCQYVDSNPFSLSTSNLDYDLDILRRQTLINLLNTYIDMHEIDIEIV